jgi:hypothetical protein
MMLAAASEHAPSPLQLPLLVARQGNRVNSLAIPSFPRFSGRRAKTEENGPAGGKQPGPSGGIRVPVS